MCTERALEERVGVFLPLQGEAILPGRCVLRIKKVARAKRETHEGSHGADTSLEWRERQVR